jgi:hypothetical protein
MMSWVPALGLLSVLATWAEPAAAPSQSKPETRTKPRPTLPVTVPGRSNPSKTPETYVRFEVLTGPDGAPLAAQEWGRLFAEQGWELTIRRSVLNEEPAVTERPLGLSRQVTAVGRLDRSGEIRFPGRAFRPTDLAELTEWVNALKTYGAQGSPEGQPLWGLTQPQFDLLFEKLSTVPQESLQNRPLAEVVAQLEQLLQVKIRWTAAADDRLLGLQANAIVRPNVNGLSCGTALAVCLRDHGLAVRPERTPQQTLELVIEPWEPENLYWPAGWPLEQPTHQALPGFFVITPIQVEAAPLMAAAEVIADVTETTVLIDTGELARRGRRIEDIEVQLPRQKSTWSLALKRMVVPQRLQREFRQDEAGRPFVWLVPFGSSKADQAE